MKAKEYFIKGKEKIKSLNPVKLLNPITWFKIGGKVIAFPIKEAYTHTVKPPFKLASKYSKKAVKKYPTHSKIIAPPAGAAAGKGLDYLVDNHMNPFLKESAVGLGEKADGALEAIARKPFEKIGDVLDGSKPEAVQDDSFLGSIAQKYQELKDSIYEKVTSLVDSIDINFFQEKAETVSNYTCDKLDKGADYLPYVGAALGVGLTTKLLADSIELKSLQKHLKKRAETETPEQVKEYIARNIARNEIAAMSSYTFDETKKLDTLCKDQTGRSMDFISEKIQNYFKSKNIKMDPNKIRKELAKEILWHEVMTNDEKYRKTIENFIDTPKEVRENSHQELESHLNTLYGDSYTPKKQLFSKEDVKSKAAAGLKYLGAAATAFALYKAIPVVLNKFGIPNPEIVTTYISVVYPLSKFGILEHLDSLKSIKNRRREAAYSVIKGLESEPTPVKQLQKAQD